MSNWTPHDWSLFFVALSALIAAVLSALAAFYANLAKIRAGAAASKANTVEGKIDENTRITKEATTQAAVNAQTAAVAAEGAKQSADSLYEQFNGKLDARILNIVAAQVDMVLKALNIHAEQDEKNMAEVNQTLSNFVKNSKLKEFADYVHQRNHDILGAIGTYTHKLDAVLFKLDQLGKP